MPGPGLASTSSRTGPDNLRLAYSAQWSDTRSIRVRASTIRWPRYATLDTLDWACRTTSTRRCSAPAWSRSTTTLRASGPPSTSTKMAVSLSSDGPAAAPVTCSVDEPQMPGRRVQDPDPRAGGQVALRSRDECPKLLVRDRTFAKRRPLQPDLPRLPETRAQRTTCPTPSAGSLILHARALYVR